MSNEHLWAGPELKLGYASYQLGQMTKAITPAQSAIEGSSTLVGNLWQTPFYASLDAFLSACYSVAEIIKCCFGEDKHPALKVWFDSLSADEQKRRCAFQNEFWDHYDAFRKLQLAKARHISVHRTGYAAVTVEISGLFGVTYIGGPTKGVPTAEVTPQPDDPALPRRPSHVLPVRPHWSDFDIDGLPLFDVCKKFLDKAGDLIGVAQEIADRVHGTHALTPPPEAAV
jgi:hypothetical protein